MGSITCFLFLFNLSLTLFYHYPHLIQATNLQFMEGYGNPRLSMDEAGYYLTTLEAAAAFIEGLKPEHMRPPEMYVSIPNILRIYMYACKICHLFVL